MATLPDEDRRRVWAHFMRAVGGLTATKAELRLAVNRYDELLEQGQALSEENIATFDDGLPESVAAWPYATHKAELFRMVKQRKVGELETEEDLRERRGTS